jgi:hypothetical protein
MVRQNGRVFTQPLGIEVDYVVETAEKIDN